MAAEAKPSTPAGRPGATAGWLVPALTYLLFVGLLGVTTKLALEDLRWPELVLWTAIAYAAIALGLLVFSERRIQLVPDTGWGALTGLFAASALIMLFLAIDAGDVSRVVPITASYPAVTLVLAAMVLHERVTAKRALATALVIVGVILLTVD